MSGAPVAVPIESDRDIEESAFTPLLRALLHAVPGVLAVVFVDGDGECIDYCTTLPPFDAKVIAAHILVIAMNVRVNAGHRSGEPSFIHLHGEQRDIAVRRISDEYALVVVTRSSGLSSLLQENIELAVRELRREASIEIPIWEPRTDGIRVEVRLSTVGWSYAPSALWHRGDRIAVTDVLGRWVEHAPAQPDEPLRALVCFMVRTETGQEFTLVHRAEEDVWEKR